MGVSTARQAPVPGCFILFCFKIYLIDLKGSLQKKEERGGGGEQEDEVEEERQRGKDLKDRPSTGSLPKWL